MERIRLPPCRLPAEKRRSLVSNERLVPIGGRGPKGRAIADGPITEVRCEHRVGNRPVFHGGISQACGRAFVEVRARERTLAGVSWTRDLAQGLAADLAASA
ncbi:MAG: hypothetical protein KatS3mg060_1323 [Dehalococcoidia bacterium]|nr:MAG: hypothetical protein KatS3mg060_1323 [Dehalococcoidia bacterium]